MESVTVLTDSVQADDDRAAVAALEKFRAELEWDEQVRDVEVVSYNIGDAALVHLKGLTKLRLLSLIGTDITNSGLENLVCSIPGRR